MNKSLRLKYLSTPRYNRYLYATLNNYTKAKKLYNANIRLAQSFHPILSQFEVVLRNSLNNELSNYFNNSNWIQDEQRGFMNHSSLRRSNYFLKNCITNTENNLRRNRIVITSGKLIANQTLGFWVALFASHHYRLIAGRPLHIFTNKPSTENRSSIEVKLKKISKFRNRVNHCEPLCFSSNNIDCSIPLETNQNIFDLIRWIEPNLIPFFKKIDNTQSKIDQIMSV